MSSPKRLPSSRCWECEELTDQPCTVTIRTTRGPASSLTLCAPCYRTCYFPLAALADAVTDPPDGTLLVEPDHPAAEIR